MAPRKAGVLTDKQQRFVAEYAIDANGTQACIRAGYAPHTANRRAHELLKDPLVKAAVAAQARAHLQQIEITAIGVLQETVKLAYGAPADRLKHVDKLRALEMLAKHLGLLKDAPPPPQFSIDVAALADKSTEDLEKALKHAEIVQNFLSGKVAP